MLDRLAAHVGVGVGQAPVAVGVPLVRLVLEGVRVHRVEPEPSLRGVRRELLRVVGAIPRDVQRHRRRHPHQILDRRAVVDLLEDVPRFAESGEAPEARPPGAHPPRRHRDGEGAGRVDDRLHVDAAAQQLIGEVLEVGVEVVGARGVVFRDEGGKNRGDAAHEGNLERKEKNGGATGIIGSSACDAPATTPRRRSTRP